MTILAGFGSGYEWLIIGFGVLLLFGGKKIPELMRGVGKGIREFNTARAQVKDELEKGFEEADAKQTAKD